MISIGITGAFGSGKSSVLAAFQEVGWETDSLDRWVHRLYADPDSGLGAELAARWGRRVLLPDGAVDRREVGRLVFADAGELAFLCDRIHPVLRRQLTSRLAAGGVRALALEVPLLFELGWESEFPATLAVWEPGALRRARLRSRGYEAAEVAARDRRQWSPERKLELADYAVINTGSPEFLKSQCKLLIKHLELENE